MRLRDRIRIETAVQRLGWWLDWKQMPGRRRREVVREVRAGLVDAEVAGDLDDALQRLGEPRAVAEAYLEDERGGLRWRAGAVAAAVALFSVTWLLFAYTIGFADGARAVGPETGETYAAGTALAVGDRPLTAFQQTERGFWVQGVWLTWPHLAAAALAFLVFAAPWRRARARSGSARTLSSNG